MVMACCMATREVSRTGTKCLTGVSAIEEPESTADVAGYV